MTIKIMKDIRILEELKNTVSKCTQLKGLISSAAKQPGLFQVTFLTGGSHHKQPIFSFQNQG